MGRAAIIIPHLPQAPPFARYAALTISMLGLQLVWSCEMAQGTRVESLGADSVADATCLLR